MRNSPFTGAPSSCRSRSTCRERVTEDYRAAMSPRRIPRRGGRHTLGQAMALRRVYIGTDGGATTSKVGAVWEDGTVVSTTLLQRSTGSQGGPGATVAGWVSAIDDYLKVHELGWDQVAGV